MYLILLTKQTTLRFLAQCLCRVQNIPQLIIPVQMTDEIRALFYVIIYRLKHYDNIEESTDQLSLYK